MDKLQYKCYVLQIDLTNLQAAFVALKAMKINSPFKSSHNADF